ncbi:Proteasome assembly chaperone 2 [Mycena indigotica]|uniref:Proteasome assembly chaperone 2 n=1 Tax=Mycena indigotica TaxID=2126181 RepID=A0A8H6TDU5_9AGAR|nr:Proteasome assembly chaperone 2 [Mycena indigotica]KAF7315469.1 Proteasome assembly chaperone 2 [Mycena indigotica]
MFFYPTEPTIPLTGKTLVVPIVSTANVSQLAADLLIATLSLVPIGRFDSSYLVPALGARENGPGVSTPLELYGKAGLDVVIIQQRSPALKSQKQNFVDALLDFINNSGVAAALFLSGVDQSNRTDSQMLTPTYHLLPISNTSTLSSTPLARLLQLPIPPYTSPVSQYPNNAEPQSPSAIEIPFIPGGSLTRRFFQTISQSPSESKVAIAGVLQFVLEGDNRADAAILASVVVAILGLQVAGFKEPSSWKQGLFGNPPDNSLYD